MTPVLRLRTSAAALALLSASGVAGREAGPPLPPSRPSAIEVALPPDVRGLYGLPGTFPTARDLYWPLAARAAREHGLPAEVADAVMRVESGYNPGAIGGVGELGLMQVRPQTAQLLGFRGEVGQLADPATNIRYGVAYLAGAWRLAGGDLCRALMKYRAGHREERMSALSVAYCRRARAHLAALGSPLGAGELPAADLGGFALSGPAGAVGASAVGPVRIVRVAGRLRKVGGRQVLRGERFWAAHRARIQAIEAKLRWKRGGIMAPG